MNADSFTDTATAFFVSFKAQAVHFLPKFLIAVGIVFLGIVTAYCIRFVLTRGIKKILSFLSLNQKCTAYVDTVRVERSTALLCNITYWLIIIVFLTIATEVLGLPVVTAWLSGISTYVPKIFIALIIGFGGVMAASILRDIVTAAVGTAQSPYSTLLGRGLQYLILILTLLICIDQIGIEITLLTNIISMLVGALALAVALSFGLGAKTCVSNILGTYYLQKQYSIGSIVTIDDKTGQIVGITPMAVIIETDEGQVSVPSKRFNEAVSLLLHRE